MQFIATPTGQVVAYACDEKDFVDFYVENLNVVNSSEVLLYTVMTSSGIMVDEFDNFQEALVCKKRSKSNDVIYIAW